MKISMRRTLDLDRPKVCHLSRALGAKPLFSPTTWGEHDLVGVTVL